MASCFGKNGDNLSAKDYSEKKRNLTLFNILRKKDKLEMDNGLRTNTATINKHGNIINYVNYENLINYKKGFEECNRDELKTHYLGQIYKKNECHHLISNDAGNNLKPPADPHRFYPKYDKEDDECICFNKNNIIKKGEAELVNLIVDGYVDYNCFFENNKKIDTECDKLDINKLINVRENICCPNKLKWSLLGQQIEGRNDENKNGISVDINAIGNIIVMGAYLFDQKEIVNLDVEQKNFIGHARVFKYNNETCKWKQLGCDIIGQDANDFSGISVSINGIGNIVAVGSAYWVGPTRKGGQVRVYQYLEEFDNGETAKAWKQIGQDISSGDLSLFGDVINLNEKGDIIAMGGVSSKDNKVYVKIYKFIDNAWQPLGNIIEQTVVESELRDFRTFSLELNAEGNIVIVSYSDSNNVTVYKLEENVWEKVSKTIKEKLDPSEVVYDVSINSKGNIVAVSSSHPPKYGKILYNTALVKKDIVWEVPFNEGEDKPENNPYKFLETFLKGCGPDDIITIGSGDLTTLWGSIEIKASRLLEIKNYCDGFEITIGQIIEPDTTTLAGKDFDVENLKVYNADKSNYVFVYIFDNLSMGFEDKSNFENNKKGVVLSSADSDQDKPSLSWHMEEFSNGRPRFLKGYAYIDENGDTQENNDVVGVYKYILKRSPPAPNVTVYRFDGESWFPLGKSIKLKEFNPLSVKLNSKGDIIAIGSPENNFNSGCIDIYKFKYNSWEKVGNNICGKNAGSLGFSIAINYEGDVVVGGAPGFNIPNNSVKVYKYDTC